MGGITNETVHLSFAVDWSKEVNPLLTSRQNNKNELILVAIDVAKHSHEVLILWPDGHQKGYRVANSFEDFAVSSSKCNTQSLGIGVF